MVDYKILWKTWGEFYNYPSCCVEYFCNNQDRRYALSSPFYGSGFVPCPSCLSKVKKMGYFEMISWLGHDPFAESKTFEESVNSDRFIELAKKNGLDRDLYLRSLR